MWYLITQTSSMLPRLSFLCQHNQHQSWPYNQGPKLLELLSLWDNCIWSVTYPITECLPNVYSVPGSVWRWICREWDWRVLIAHSSQLLHYLRIKVRKTLLLHFLDWRKLPSEKLWYSLTSSPSWWVSQLWLTKLRY